MICKFKLIIDHPRAIKIIFIALILIKLVLVSRLNTYVLPTENHDDMLMFERAVSITGGRWLGPYNQLTLSKGVFFTSWLAVLNLFSIPLLIGNELLYIASCLVFVFSIKSIINNKLLMVLIFIVLLFNPISLGFIPMLRIYRDPVSPALTMLIFSGVIGTFLHKNDSGKMLLFSCITGSGLSAAW